MSFSPPCTLKVRCVIHEDEVGFIAHCPTLDVYSQGDTQEEAFEHLREALDLFVDSCTERGVLREVLEDCGVWQERSVPSLAVAKELGFRGAETATPYNSHEFEAPVPSHIDLQLPFSPDQ